MILEIAFSGKRGGLSYCANNFYMEENMKKLSKLAAFAAALVAAVSLVFVGCSDISSDDASVSSGYTKATSSASSKTLTLNVTSDSELIDFSTSELTEAAREIIPAPLDSSKVKFYLGGTDLVTGSALTVQQVSFTGKVSGTAPSTTTSTKEGTITVDLEASNYRFTLVAVLEGVTPASGWVLSNYISSAVLIAYATADLRYTEEAAAVNFVLTSDGLSGSGTLDIDFYLDDWEKAKLELVEKTAGGVDTLVIADATIGLYDIETGNFAFSGSKVNPFDLSGANLTNDAKNNLEDHDPANFTGLVNYDGGDAADSLTAGTYDIAITFTLKNGNKYIWSDKIIILPNQTTKAIIGIPDEVIECPPADPSDFKIGYIAPAYSDSDYYKVVFNWKDNSKNEQYFELDLYDVTADTDNFTPATLNTVAKWSASTSSNTKTFSYNFYGLKAEKGPNWYAGSLNRNNTQAVFYIELGKRYLARIRAVNEAGPSEYATTVITTATGDVVNTGASDYAFDETTMSKVYSTAAVTAYTISAGLSTAETASLANDETRDGTTTEKVIKFNTNIINLFRVRYELSGGAFTEGAIDTVYYFDQLTAGNPIMMPDGKDTYNLADITPTPTNTNAKIYNEGAVLNLEYGEGDSAKKWTSWKIASISGDKYPYEYTACTAGGAPVDGTTYYKVSSTTATADINGNTTTYVVEATPDTLAATDFTITGLANYMGYSNIVLYASYSSSTFGVVIKNVEDYTIEKLLNISLAASGTGTPKLAEDNSLTSIDVLKTNSDVTTKVQGVTVNRNQTSGTTTTTASNLVFTVAYIDSAETAFNYEKLLLEVYQQGDSSGKPVSVGVYTVSAGKFTVPISAYKTGTYIATVKAYVPSSNNKAPYEYSVNLQIND